VPSEREDKEFTDRRSGETYRFRASGLGLHRWISGGGAFTEGPISAGTGEVTMPRLMILRLDYPIPVAVASSLVLVVTADLSAAITCFVQFVVREGVWEPLGMSSSGKRREWRSAPMSAPVCRNASAKRQH
jgi:uncharacterized membrane protein YfcA